MIDPIVESLARSKRPLIVCDIDEVVLEFLTPLHDYLQSVEHGLHADSFRLHGNIRRISDGFPATKDEVARFQEAFFSTQDRWQKPAKRAKEVLDDLNDMADIVLLTAMPPQHHALRRALLDTYDLHFPMIATEEAKGPVVRRLIGQRQVPSVFIDDICSNLYSVREHAPSCLLINLIANDAFRALAPDPGEAIESVRDWDQAADIIRAHLQPHA